MYHNLQDRVNVPIDSSKDLSSHPKLSVASSFIPWDKDIKAAKPFWQSSIDSSSTFCRPLPLKPHLTKAVTDCSHGLKRPTSKPQDPYSAVILSKNHVPVHPAAMTGTRGLASLRLPDLDVSSYFLSKPGKRDRSPSPSSAFRLADVPVAPVPPVSHRDATAAGLFASHPPASSNPLAASGAATGGQLLLPPSLSHWGHNDPPVAADALLLQFFAGAGRASAAPPLARRPGAGESPPPGKRCSADHDGRDDSEEPSRKPKRGKADEDVSNTPFCPTTARPLYGQAAQAVGRPAGSPSLPFAGGGWPLTWAGSWALSADAAKSGVPGEEARGHKASIGFLVS